MSRGAITTLPDSNGRLINIPSFAGTQFLIETSRKDKRKILVSALENKLPLKDFKKIWQVRGRGKREINREEGRERKRERERERERKREREREREKLK